MFLNEENLLLMISIAYPKGLSFLGDLPVRVGLWNFLSGDALFLSSCFEGFSVRLGGLGLKLSLAAEALSGDETSFLLSHLRSFLFEPFVFSGDPSAPLVVHFKGESCISRSSLENCIVVVFFVFRCDCCLWPVWINKN